MKPHKLIAILFAVGLLPLIAQAGDKPFNVMETSIADIHAAMRAGKLTCHSLVQQYLDRIQAYDKQGPALNAILYINPKALQQADEMDAQFKRTRKMEPLHCIPVILKDNYDTADMPTTAGSSSLAGSIPPQDATTVAKLRKAGALILAKANLHEFAAAGGTTVSSLGGQTKNPYDLKRTPGGSSGGTGAAMAANFGTVGTGSDTVNSIRSPASANSLVGFRPTRGLVSTAGVVPISFTEDAVGPITRNVSDAARMLDVMHGYDPRDQVTAFSVGQSPATYTAFLKTNALKGARIGVLQTLFGNGPEHQEVNQTMNRALDSLKQAGAVLVPVSDPALDTAALYTKFDVQVYEYRSNINAYLKGRGPNAPVHSLGEILASGKYYKPLLEAFMTKAESYENGLNEPEYKSRLAAINNLRVRVANLLAENNLVALVFPHQKCLVVPIGQIYQVDRNGILGALTGFPAITLPGGFSTPTTDAPLGVPVGIEFLGRPWSEVDLISVAYSFEQATRFRKPPLSVPPLSN
jgi:Asp-tRNA(Asn)/Glu-tRNA(Gln) amidotransferase A subunit family amidase